MWRKYDGDAVTGKGWRPRTLRPFYLLFLASIMFLMMGAVELLRRSSNIRGGLVFYDDTDDIPDHVSFAYNYVPVILGLSLLTLWSFTVYDVFRLEPYFQLSKEQACPADVLSANYNFGPFVTTPIFSARRKHWVVLLVSLVNISVQLLLPAMLSALMDVDEVSVFNTETLRSWPELLEVENQAEWISSQRNMSLDSFTRTYYGELPSRLAEFAIPPVELPFDDEVTTALWELNHTVYWTELSCSDSRVHSPSTGNIIVSMGEPPGEHSKVSYELDGLQLAFLSGSSQNCTLSANYSGIFDLKATSIQARRWELDALPCATGDLYGFLLDINSTDISQLARQTNIFPTQNSTFTPKAEFFTCGMRFYMANAEISMRPNGSVVAINVDEGSVSSLDTSRLNIPGIKTYLNHEVCPKGNISPFDNGTLIKHSLDRCASEMGNSIPSSLGSQQFSQAPISIDRFMFKIRRDVKRGFARLLSRLFDTNAAYTTVQGVRTTDQVAIVVIDSLAFISEIILLLGGATCIFLAFFYQSRENMLTADPGSIAAMYSIVADLFNPAGVQAFAQYTDQYTARELNRKLRAWQCYWYCEPSGRKLGFIPGEISSRKRNGRVWFKKQMRRNGPRPNARLHFLSTPIFVAELLGLLTVICSMTILFAMASNDGRLGHLSDAASDRLSFALGIVPSIIASMMRALFNSIYLNLSVLEPWIHLQRGGSDARRSLLLNISCQNPITVFYRSIRSRHFVLSLVSLCCIINIGLPAVLGTLFTQSRMESPWPTQDVKLRYDDSVILESSMVPNVFQYGPIESAILNEVQWLPWTAPDYSFIPFSAATNSLDRTYQAVTLGIGANLDCQKIPLMHNVSEERKRGVSSSHPFASARDTEHMSSIRSHRSEDGRDPYSIQALALSENKGDNDNNEFFVFSTGNSRSKGGLQNSQKEIFALQCQPVASIDRFTVGFSANGIVQYYVPMESTITSGQLFNNVTSNLAKYQRQFVSSLQDASENSTTADGAKLFPSEWPGTLIKLVYQQTNPELTYVDPDLLIDATTRVYKWLFATYFSFCRDMHLKPLPKPILVSDAKVLRATWSIVRCLPPFIIALVMVTLMAIALVLVFIVRQGQFKGPRIPRSLGSMLAWLADSPILPTFYGTYHWSNAQRRDYLLTLDKRYIFRQITTPSGAQKWAIEEDPVAKAT
ncbi:hypothetical protein BDV23DRAFT_157120 [Aspergillus alliaceus]|uniref:Uncharacterized protein n=1 Tax=Petromyces alliaceus TaxID=209559 RepID=A0A5N7C5V2_PETAA|nr:hypothetical protein BDV23DRAFT_157120 [Aspergillus alliaceus]